MVLSQWNYFLLQRRIWDFWFKHHYKSTKTSVINGAQTITNFFNCLDLFKYTIKEKIDNPNNNIEQDYKNLVIDALENITKEIFVKAIFIDADKNKDEKYVKIITEGLNTQVPVLEEDLVASSSDVETLNKILQKCRAEILKPGYTAQKNMVWNL